MNRRNLSYLLILAAMAALLAACGGAATTQPAAVPTAASSTEAATAQPTATPSTASSSDPTTPAATGSEAGAEVQNTAAASTAPAKLNLNQVTSDDLMAAIPGFSSRMVREFQEYRPYVSIQQFRKEIGKYVDEAQVTEWEQYVYVPVAVDASDAETLKQLPGVDDTVAQALIDGRPYGSNDAFLAKLASQVGDAQAAAAAAYLAAN